MKSIHAAKIDAKYWFALVLASIFGANTGDFLADVVGLGHISGLPVLAVLLVIIFVAERFDQVKHPVYFWAAIIVIRTSATNIGDITGDLNLTRPLVLGGLTLALGLVVLVWQLVWKKQGKRSDSTSLATVPIYWVAMLLAGTLGTVAGDFCSYELWDLLAGLPHQAFGGDMGLVLIHNLNAALLLGLPLGILFLLTRKNGLQTQLAIYWILVVLIRSAGTAAGDFTAHSFLGLPLSTLLSGLLFVGFLVCWPAPEKRTGLETERG